MPVLCTRQLKGRTDVTAEEVRRPKPKMEAGSRHLCHHWLTPPTHHAHRLVFPNWQVADVFDVADILPPVRIFCKLVHPVMVEIPLGSSRCGPTRSADQPLMSRLLLISRFVQGLRWAWICALTFRTDRWDADAAAGGTFAEHGSAPRPRVPMAICTCRWRWRAGVTSCEWHHNVTVAKVGGVFVATLRGRCRSRAQRHCIFPSL